MIESQWKWDRSSQNAGEPPSQPIVMKLNESLTFHFNGRNQAYVHFNCDGVVKDFDIGIITRTLYIYILRYRVL